MQGRKGHRMGENTPSILLATFVLAPILHLTSSCPYRTHRAGFGLIPIASVDSLHLFWFNREFASLTTGYLQPFSAWSKPSQPSRKKHNTLTEIFLSTTWQKLGDQPSSWHSSVREVWSLGIVRSCLFPEGGSLQHPIRDQAFVFFTLLTHCIVGSQRDRNRDLSLGCFDVGSE